MHLSITQNVSYQQSIFTPDDYAEAINLVRQRPAEPPIFLGDPMEYQDWKVAFNDALNLSYLAAWANLDNRYGKEKKVAEAYLDKIKNWPKIKLGDAEALEDFIDLLESVEGLDTDINLNTKAANKKLIVKIPYQIGEKWADQSTSLERNNGRFLPLKTFIKFLSHHCDIAHNSLSKALHESGSHLNTKPHDISTKCLGIQRRHLLRSRPKSLHNNLRYPTTHAYSVKWTITKLLSVAR